jgi:hypothetical protein
MAETVFDLLNFPKKFQFELLRHLIVSPEFYRSASPMLKVSDFDFPPCQIVYDALCSYWRAHKKQPDPAILDLIVADFAQNGGSESMALRMEEQPAFNEFWLGIRMQYGAPLNLEYFQAQLVRFIQSARFNTIMAGVQGGSPEAIRQALLQAQELKKLEGQIGAGTIQFTDAWKDHIPLAPENYIRIPTGIIGIDNNTDNGLGPGEMGMVMACPGVGKSNTLLNIAGGAVSAGYRVLFITFELSKMRVEQRFHSITANIYAKSLRRPAERWTDAEFHRWVFVREHIMPMGLVVYDFSRKTNTPLEAVDTVIKQWKHQMLERFGTIGPPLLVCLDWLHPQYIRVQHPRDAKSHEILAALAKEVNAMARDNSVALWAACQGNRGADGKEILDMRDAAGAYDISQPIDVGVGIAPMRDMSIPVQVFTNAGEDDNNTAGDLVQDGRMLSMNSFKNRDNMPFKFELFQGPTLRLFTQRSAWQTIERALREDNGMTLLRKELCGERP